MTSTRLARLAAFLLVLAAAACAAAAHISGTLADGYRVLVIPGSTRPAELTVYRGDYLKFAFPPQTGARRLTIPALAVDRVLPGTTASAPYVKMKRTGTFAFALGAVQGTITVVEYAAAHYRALTVEQAARFIRDETPLVLDVRTRREFAVGHLENAVLLPVQELQRRLGELARYKNQPILIYCATGNRSTVASKILIDNGFGRVANMRHGIVQWKRRNHPLVK